MGKVIGIDLGTTNSCVAVLEGADPVVIPNAEGGRTTPSMVAFAENGDRLVGHVAKRQAITNPTRTVFAVKRLMGRKARSAEMQRAKDSYPYVIAESPNGDAAVAIDDRRYAPPEISAQILEHLRAFAEEYLGEDISDAVITVPAYFDDSQRQATRDAGRIAGLNVLRIINEPTAAALAYGYGLNSSSKSASRVAVYDLGGGTFDISILEVGDGVFQVKATHGDTYLGGEDIDRTIIEYLSDRFHGEHGIDLRSDAIALQRLKEAAEKAKIELSTLTETEINLPFIHADDNGPRHMQLPFTRDQLEEMMSPLVERTIDHCREVLRDAKVSARDIDEVILVGGLTKAPIVQKAVSDFFKVAPHRGVSPDEAVAVGAAIQGGIIAGEVDNVLLLDVVPLSLGIETQGGIFTKLIERNAPIPTSVPQIFTTAEDYQPLVNIHVLQGERPMAKDNKSLARFELVGIPPARRGVPKIEVSFDVDANGILSVSARDLGTGNEQSIRVRPTGGLSDREVDRIIREAESLRDADSTKRDVATLRVKADALVYTTERSLGEFMTYLTDEEVQQIHTDLDRCKAASEGSDLEALKSAIRHLEQSAYRIAEVMYKDVS